MLFDEVLSETLSTDIWQATTTTYADYSAEVILPHTRQFEIQVSRFRIHFRIHFRIQDSSLDSVYFQIQLKVSSLKWNKYLY